MGLIFRFILSSIIGFVAHVFWKPTRKFGRNHGARWGAKIRDAIGILTLAVPFVLVTEKLPMKESKTKNYIGLMLTALFYGAGNFLAHLLDSE